MPNPLKREEKKFQIENATFQTAKKEATKILNETIEEEDVEAMHINVKSFPNPNVIEENYN